MTPPFPPQLFILLGVDIFLGGSVLTVMFDDHFPTGLPYVMDFGALAGFIQLVLTPQYLTGFPEDVQFYACAVYAAIAVLAVVGTNLYVVFTRGERMLGGVLALPATIPSVLVTVFFVSAYLNEVQVALPTAPLLPWEVVWGAFFGASALILMAMVIAARRKGISPQPVEEQGHLRRGRNTN